MVEMIDLVKLVGEENVLDDAGVLEEYTRDMSFVRPISPKCVVKPKSASEVQSIVKWANDTGTPLVPVSSGPPHFHGDTIPGTSIKGVVMVDLSRMRQIIRVDRRNRVVMIEPGVTFGELIPALEKEDLSPLMTLAPRSSKSVVTSFLEREPITKPRFHWEAMDPLLCTEVIYGSGDLFRTGSAGGPGTIEEQWKVGRAQARGMGPSQVDFTRLLQAAQGTMGIITWATVKCIPLPKVKETYLVASENVERLIEFAYKILWKKLGEQCLILNGLSLASIMAADSERIKALRDKLPPWVLVYSIEGAGLLPREKVDYQREESVEVAKSFGLALKTTIPGIKAKDVSVALSQPSAEPYWKLRYKGGCQDIFFLTTMDKTPGFIKKVHELAGDYQYPLENIGVYIQPMVQGTNCHCEFELVYNPRVPGEAEKVRRFIIEGSQELADMGAFFSRPYGSWTSIAYAGNEQTAAGHRKLKNIFDPNWIMNPGKLCFGHAYE